MPLMNWLPGRRRRSHRDLDQAGHEGQIANVASPRQTALRSKSWDVNVASHKVQMNREDVVNPSTPQKLGLRLSLTPLRARPSGPRRSVPIAVPEIKLWESQAVEDEDRSCRRRRYLSHSRSPSSERTPLSDSQPRRHSAGVMAYISRRRSQSRSSSPSSGGEVCVVFSPMPGVKGSSLLSPAAAETQLQPPLLCQRKVLDLTMSQEDNSDHWHSAMARRDSCPRNASAPRRHSDTVPEVLAYS